MRHLLHHATILRAVALCLLLLSQPANAATHLVVSEANLDSVNIAVSHSGKQPACSASDSNFFSPSLHLGAPGGGPFVQPLNSEMDEAAVYLKAARMGGGIYMHLPYFVPLATCKNVIFEVRARHILWDGEWHTGSLSIPAVAVKDKSIFFTNETAPLMRGASYFDASFDRPTLDRLEPAFASIIGFYKKVLHAEPMRGIGVVAAIARNKGNYSGFGGDALNIIRMSYDNPTAQQLQTVGDVFPSTFAHELGHKLQSEQLFAQPLARHIVEGSADFLKIVVLHNAGLIDESQAKARILKAVADCVALAGPATLRDKARRGAIGFREPYDCGMVYYFTSYYASGLDGAAYVDVLRKALSGARHYGREPALCLYFERSCRNQRLNGVTGNLTQLKIQTAWLQGQLARRPLPVLTPR